MKQANAYTVAVTAISVYLGAGFLSGQELFNFFGVFGAWGFVGVALAAGIFFFVVFTILSFASESGYDSAERLIVGFDSPPVRTAVTIFEGVFLFLIDVLMVAAAGALIADAFGFSLPLGCALFAAISLAVSLFGLTGLLRVFSFIVPPLAFFTLFLAAGGTVRAGGLPALSAAGGNLGFVSSAFFYVTFNTVCSVPILAPVGARIKNKRHLRLGVLFASLAFFAVSSLILAVLFAVPAARNAELPMLFVASTFGKTVYGIFAALLCTGVFATSISCKTALSLTLRTLCPKRAFHTVLVFLLALCSFLISLSGFRTLVSIIYPIFGYIGVLPLAMLIYHAYQYKKKP